MSEKFPFKEITKGNIKKRTFLIKNAIEWKKFTSGAI